MEDAERQDIALETPAENVFIAPSVHKQQVIGGTSYTHHSSVPEELASNPSTDCVLGVDEAGRGPVLGAHPTT